MKEKQVQVSDKYIVRFPDGMRDRIAEAAKASGRSMNAEIVHRLQKSFIVEMSASAGLGISSNANLSGGGVISLPPVVSVTAKGVETRITVKEFADMIAASLRGSDGQK